MDNYDILPHIGVGPVNLKMDRQSVVDTFGTPEKNDPELGYSYIFKKLQMSLWRRLITDNEQDVNSGKFEAIGIGVDGYFE